MIFVPILAIGGHNYKRKAFCYCLYSSNLANLKPYGDDNNNARADVYFLLL